MDYSQNIYIPNFGGEQTGSTYNLSSRIFYQFVIVEFTTSCDITYYNVYHESEVKKGGKKYLSCLVDNFKDIGFLTIPSWER